MTVQANFARLGALVMLALAASCAAGPHLPGFAEEMRPCDIRSREFAVGSTDDVTIAGVLSTPGEGRRYPALLLLHGNGPHDRDQMISNSPMFRMIADYFLRRGVAVVRYDRRGYGASTGTDFEHHTTADSAADARAVIEWMRAQPELDPDEIALFGHSEGAMTGAMIAAADIEIARLIFMSPPGLSGAETWANQLAANLRRRGASDEVANAVHAVLLRYAAWVAAGPHPEDDPAFYEIGYDFLAAHDIPEADNTPAFARQLLSGYRVPWYRFFFGYDIADDLRRVRRPVIAAFAEFDENVPPKDHMAPFLAALAEGGNINVAAKILPDEDHFFLRHNDERLEKHVPGEMTVSQALLDYVAANLTGGFTPRKECAG